MKVLTKLYMEIRREEATLDTVELYLQSPILLGGVMLNVYERGLCRYHNVLAVEVL
jgi:hypothetical protein